MVEERNDGDEPYPKAPDLKRVHEMRARLRAEKAARDVDRARSDSHLGRKYGKAAKDLGAYTLIPSLMIAGPIVGYLLGRSVEKWLGGEPWGAVIGMLVGVAAAFREVFRLIQRKRPK